MLPTKNYFLLYFFSFKSILTNFDLIIEKKYCLGSAGIHFFIQKAYYPHLDR